MNVTTTRDAGAVGEYPAVLPLLREDDEGTEQLAGWLFVLDTEVVSYQTQPGQHGTAVGMFSSVESAARVLAHGGIWFAPTSGDPDRMGVRR